MARIEPELKVTDRLGEMEMFLLKEMVALSLMKSLPEKRSWLLFGFSWRESASTAKLSESRAVKVKGVSESEELEIEREAPFSRLRFAPFSSVRVELLAKFSEDPSARFNSEP